METRGKSSGIRGGRKSVQQERIYIRQKRVSTEQIGMQRAKWEKMERSEEGERERAKERERRGSEDPPLQGRRRLLIDEAQRYCAGAKEHRSVTLQIVVCLASRRRTEVWSDRFRCDP